jgi:hypothetical protein
MAARIIGGIEHAPTQCWIISVARNAHQYSFCNEKIHTSSQKQRHVTLHQTEIASVLQPHSHLYLTGFIAF